MKVTEAFLGLDENIKKCQTNMPIGECKSIFFLQEVKNRCNCVPYNLRNFTNGNEVFMKPNSIDYLMLLNDLRLSVHLNKKHV